MKKLNYEPEWSLIGELMVNWLFGKSNGVCTEYIRRFTSKVPKGVEMESKW